MLPDRSEQRPIITLYRLHRPSLREGFRGPGRLGRVIRCQRVIRCRFIFSGKNDELTPDFPTPDFPFLTPDFRISGKNDELTPDFEEHTITQSVLALEQPAAWKALESFAENGSWHQDRVTWALTPPGLCLAKTAGYDRRKRSHPGTLENKPLS